MTRKNNARPNDGRIHGLVLRHSFRQSDVGEKRSDWARFASLADELGYRIRVTGGAEYTHEINCSPLDFWALVELSQNAGGDAHGNI